MRLVVVSSVFQTVWKCRESWCDVQRSVVIRGMSSFQWAASFCVTTILADCCLTLWVRRTINDGGITHPHYYILLSHFSLQYANSWNASQNNWWRIFFLPWYVFQISSSFNVCLLLWQIGQQLKIISIIFLCYLMFLKSIELLFILCQILLTNACNKCSKPNMVNYNYNAV